MRKIPFNDKRSLKLLIITQLTVVLLIYLISFHITNSTLKYICSLLTVLLSITSYCILFRIIRGIIVRAQTDARNEAILKQKQIQEEHYAALEQSRERVLSMKDTILQTLMEGDELEEKSEQEKKNTINTLIRSYREINMIDNCKNKVVDAILYNKALLAKSKHVPFHIMALLPEEIAIDPVDIMCIFTNLLDNAIDANMKLEEQKRYIRIETKLEANYLVVKVENAKLSTETVLVEKHSTTKDDKTNHGLGLSFVKSTCDKLDGSLSIENQVDSIKISALLRIQDNV